jgi:hypothetical protein
MYMCIKFEINMYSFSGSNLDLHQLVLKAQQKRDGSNSSNSSKSHSQRRNQRGSIIVGVSSPKALDILSAFNSALLVSPFRRHLSTTIEDAIFLGMIDDDQMVMMMKIMIGDDDHNDDDDDDDDHKPLSNLMINISSSSSSSSSRSNLREDDNNDYY